MAQLVEHILGKDEVPSSNLGSSSRKPPTNMSGALVFWSLADRRDAGPYGVDLKWDLSLFCDRIQYCHSLLLLLCSFRFILFFCFLLFVWQDTASGMRIPRPKIEKLAFQA